MCVHIYYVIVKVMWLTLVLAFMICCTKSSDIIKYPLIYYPEKYKIHI